MKRLAAVIVRVLSPQCEVKSAKIGMALDARLILSAAARLHKRPCNIFLANPAAFDSRGLGRHGPCPRRRRSLVMTRVFPIIAVPRRCILTHSPRLPEKDTIYAPATPSSAFASASKWPGDLAYTELAILPRIFTSSIFDLPCLRRPRGGCKRRLRRGVVRRSAPRRSFSTGWC